VSLEDLDEQISMGSLRADRLRFTDPFNFLLHRRFHFGWSNT